jgi:hypothetical protein
MKRTKYDMDPGTLRELAEELDKEAAYREECAKRWPGGNHEANVDWLVKRLRGLSRSYRNRATRAEKARAA